MENKKNIKKALSAVISIVVVIAIGISGYCTYNYFKLAEEEKINSQKSYAEIIEGLNTDNFDKNKFNNEFLVKKINTLSSVDDITYYDINCKEVDKYVPETVLATWSDISNYQSSLYTGLDINAQIPYTAQMLYRNDLPDQNIFYLEACKTDYSAVETIKDSFDNNNVGLFWSAKCMESGLTADEVISVPNKTRKKWGDNEFGIFTDLLGYPSRIHKLPDADKKDVGEAYEELNLEYDIERTYYIFWEYDEYYIGMYLETLVKGEEEVLGRISQIMVQSKNSNSTSGDYKTIISLFE